MNRLLPQPSTLCALTVAACQAVLITPLSFAQQLPQTSSTMPQDALSPLLQDSLNTQVGKPKQPLQAIVGMPSTLTIVPGQIVLKKFRGIKIKVTNDTDRPIVFDGDNAIATASGVSYNSASLVQLEEINRLPHTFGQKLSSDLKATTTATVTVGAVQAAEGFKSQAGPILPRYEGDEKRRELEDTRFGKRVVYPGEVSEGVLYFQTNASMQGAVLQLPASSLYDHNDKAAVSRRVD
ncbi:MAG: hypothetical protein P4L53_08605 [Candidatus Obscuribacterales bacterium]|nr:hypothetical protein [Candidatus Obscuribacterales bacterium]